MAQAESGDDSVRSPIRSRFRPESFSFSCGFGSGRARVWRGLADSRCRSVPDSGVSCPADPRRDPGPISCAFRFPIPPPIWTVQCGESGTVRDGLFVFPECRGGVEGF
jgi:hypothetical protein